MQQGTKVITTLPEPFGTLMVIATFGVAKSAESSELL